ncbi:MAG: hypothetical protein KAQ64_03530 [Candidatus Pacebacteria bacterium]|nr:hypothetical protein [Candidatus Paceibacterota bacterium]
MQVRSVAPVSRVTVIFPVEVTFSEKVRSMSITFPVVYELLALSELIEMMVGGDIVNSKSVGSYPCVRVNKAIVWPDPKIDGAVFGGWQIDGAIPDENMVCHGRH